MQTKRIPGMGIHLVHSITRSSQRSIQVSVGMVALQKSPKDSLNETSHINPLNQHNLVFSTINGNPIEKNLLNRLFLSTVSIFSTLYHWRCTWVAPNTSIGKGTQKSRFLYLVNSSPLNEINSAYNFFCML